ncbi:MAG: NADH-quinone oxidoreductase subunit G, partial [Armatimonadetes bacterium]|nr:NADH-quinone oxidoreductase subunit G [Armatimonadota bacterium]
PPHPHTPTPPYPFVLATGQMLFHSGTLSTWAPEMRTINAGTYVEIAPKDAEGLGIAHGERVRLVSHRGEVVLPAHIQPGGTPGILFVANHHAEPRVNRLLDREAVVDRVRVERA